MSRINPRRRATLAALLASPFLSLSAQAQGSDWPNRPVRVVVPWPPGGGADTTARMIFPKLAQKLGQPFVIENRPGASGSIGAAEVARATPDGYTLLHDATPLAINPFLIRVSFDALADLKAVFLPMQVPMLLVMHPSQAPRSLADVIALAKSRPGSLDWASSGNGSAQHLALELFTRAAGITVNHVPYRGGGPASQALATGEVAFSFATFASVMPMVQAGTVRGLAVSGAERSAEFPNLPTVAEALSLPGYRTLDWHALAGPAGLPADRRARIAAAFHHALARPELAQRLQAAGATPAPSTPQQMEDFVRAEIEHYTALARSTGIKAE